MTTEAQRRLAAAERERKRIAQQMKTAVNGSRAHLRTTLEVLDKVIAVLDAKVAAQTLWKTKRTPRDVKPSHPLRWVEK